MTDPIRECVYWFGFIKTIHYQTSVNTHNLTKTTVSIGKLL